MTHTTVTNLPLEFLYAIPLRGVEVLHLGTSIRMRWQAGEACSVRIVPNADGDVQLAGPRHLCMTLGGTVDTEIPVTIRSRLQGSGWLASHTELWCDHAVESGKVTLEIDTTEFRLCQNEGCADFLLLEWQAAASGQFTITDMGLEEQSGGEFFAPRVDRFGQRVGGCWRGKVSSDAELKADAELTLPEPVSDQDSFGGCSRGGTDEPTGYFHVEKVGDAWWFITPEGAPFRSFGACCVSAGVLRNVTSGREELYAELPPREGLFLGAWEGALPGCDLLPEIHPLSSFGGDTDSSIVNFYIANLMRKWGKDWFSRWGATTVARLKGWGMNTLACWSDLDLAAKADMPYCVPADRLCPGSFDDLLPGEDAAPFPLRTVPDVLHPDFEGRAQGWFEGLSAFREDPYLLGYFVGNEEMWCLWQSPFSFPAHWESRRIFIQELRECYGSITKLNTAWNCRFGSFDQLANFRHAENPPGLTDEGTQICDAFMRRFTEKYFQVIRRELRAVDPNHLFLGCRFLALPPRSCILEGAWPSMDVVSINWYMWRKQTVEDVGEFLGNWNRLCGGKPLVISEYAFTATDERLLACHLPHSDQTARAEMTEQFSRACFALPFVVGMHWFQYVDQPILGRSLGDGERGNFGLVDVCDRPHLEVTQALKRIALSMYSEVDDG